jgi:hypothetical protein
MQGFLASVAAQVLEAAASLVADENDAEIASAAISAQDVEFAEVLSFKFVIGWWRRMEAIAKCNIFRS